jgi:nucleoside-diphosphate-sugar epimerase
MYHYDKYPVSLILQLKYARMVINYRLLGKWPNTYAFTKAIAEDTVREFGKNLPIAVVRPAVGGYLIFVSHGDYGNGN